MSKYLAAYLLLNAAGSTPSADGVKSVLESVGIEVEEERISQLFEAVEGKSVEELIAEGNEKISAAPGGSAGAAPAGAEAAASTEAAEEEAAEEEEESDADMGFGLFD